MSLGLGIFLAALVIAAVMLRDKVRWGRLFLGFILLVAGVGSGLYLYNWYASLPTYQKQYEDVALGMDRNEILYVKGTPSSGFYPTYRQQLLDQGKDSWDAFISSFIETKYLSREMSINDASYLVYKTYKAYVRVYFNDKGPHL